MGRARARDGLGNGEKNILDKAGAHRSKHLCKLTSLISCGASKKIFLTCPAFKYNNNTFYAL
jgi:hypothetical protein